MSRESENTRDSIIMGTHKKYGYFLKKLIWQSRFFVLRNNGDMYYYSKENSSKHKKTPVGIKRNRFWKSNLRRHCLHVDRSSKPFYIAFDDYQDYVRWQDAFEDVGGIKSKPELVDFLSGFKCSLVGVKVKKWNNEQILDWLSFISTTESESYSKYEKCFAGVTKGVQLLNLTAIALKNMGVDDVTHRERIMKNILHLNDEKGVFGIDHYIVHHKLREVFKNSNGIGKLKLSMEHHFSKILSNMKDLGDTYLNEKYQKTLSESSASYFENIEEKQEELEGENENNEREKTDFENLMFEDSFSEDYLVEDKIPIRIIFHESLYNFHFKNMKNFLNPVISVIPKFRNREFCNPLRIAFVIGETYLEWNESSLIIPKRVTGDVARLISSIDPVHSLPKQKYDEVMKKIAKFVSLFNSKRFFQIPVNSGEERFSEKEEEDGKTKCSSFHAAYSYRCTPKDFYKEGMKFFGINYPLSNKCWNSFIEKLDQSDGGEIDNLVFVPSSGFHAKFYGAMKRKKEIQFSTHLEFDEFVGECRETDELSFMMEFKNEVKMLREYDRLFWIRHRANGMKKNSSFSPKTTENGECGCFFGDIDKLKNLDMDN